MGGGAQVPAHARPFLIFSFFPVNIQIPNPGRLLLVGVGLIGFDRVRPGRLEAPAPLASSFSPTGPIQGRWNPPTPLV